MKRGGNTDGQVNGNPDFWIVNLTGAIWLFLEQGVAKT